MHHSKRIHDHELVAGSEQKRLNTVHCILLALRSRVHYSAGKKEK